MTDIKASTMSVSTALAFSFPVLTFGNNASEKALAPLPKRPPGAPLSAFPYHKYIVRSWQPQDREGAAAVVRDALKPYGLSWEPEGADADAVVVDEHYHGDTAEFWVVCDELDQSKVYGTAAFRPWERSPSDTAELRKLYLCSSSGVRDVGLGSFLVDACETRAAQLGFKYAVIETASQMTEAVRLYKHKGYSPITDVDTLRCDIAMRKTLALSDDFSMEEQADSVIAVDKEGFSVASVPRAKTRRWRMMYGAVVVLILSQDGERILVQRRSMEKSNFPGVLDPFVAGGVSEPSLLRTCAREMHEELGLDASIFEWSPLWHGVYTYDRGVGDRCCFWGFVARSTRPEAELLTQFVDGEVDECMWMTRSEVDAANMPSPVWSFASSLPAPSGMQAGFFSTS